nr:putative ribonuclease H-like domain-containing protein [Tanacetum cinerariifolium]
MTDYSLWEVIDSGCSRHMTENISYLSEFEEINKGYVAFGGNPKGGKITSKGFEDPDYPDKVYKVVKALYGLHQAPRAWYETLANYLLENGFQRGKIDQTLFIKKQKDVKSDGTPIDTEKPLLKDPNVKRNFRYLKGKLHLGLWYPKDSPFNLVAFSDSDYTGASLYRKSTIGGYQFLGYRLISWQCKKQTVVATSSTEAEYIAAASCCAQVLWIQNQKRVGPLATHRLALRYSVDYSSSDHFTIDDSSRVFQSDSLSETSSDSPCDLPTATFARPSRNRRRSPTTSVPTASPVLEALSPVRADLLPPRKRIRDSNSVTDFELEGQILELRLGLRPREEAESSAIGTIEIGVDRVTHHIISDDIAEPVRDDFLELVSADGSLERDQGHRITATNQQSAAMSERIGTLEWDNIRLRGMLGVERQRVDCVWRSMSTMLTATHSGMTQDAINELIAKCVEEDLQATVRVDAAYVMTWKALMKLMTQVYFLRNEIQKMKTELIQDAIHIANNLMDRKLKGYAIKNAENKRRFDNNSRDNPGQQPQPFKRQNVNRQNVARAYTVGNNVERKGDYKAIVAATALKAPIGNQTSVTCYENNEAKTRAYAIRGGGANPDSNVAMELDSFDVIVGMDWLAQYHVVIVCDKKIVRIPYGDEVLIIEGDGCNGGSQQRVVKCVNCQEEGHMAGQCPKPKRKRDATWFRDKVLLFEAHGSGKVLNEEELAFLVDLELQKVQLHRRPLHTMQLIKQMIWMHMILTVTRSLQPKQFLWPVYLVTDQMFSLTYHTLKTLIMIC